MIQLMKGDSFLVAELQQTAMRDFIRTSWLDEREASDRRAIGCAIAHAVTPN
jgi:hypothetical protein